MRTVSSGPELPARSAMQRERLIRGRKEDGFLPADALTSRADLVSYSWGR